MTRADGFLVFGCILYLVAYASSTLIIRQIIGPDSIEIDTTEKLVLDCDFDATDEEQVELKWFFNGLQDQIYQWIPPARKAFAMGTLKDFIDPTYRISSDPDSMLRALQFREIGPALTGNYTCKVETTDDMKFVTKQLIVYAPPTSFQMFLSEGGEDYTGDEVVLCEATNVFPKPEFDLILTGENGTLDWPEHFRLRRTEIPDEAGFYNVSLMLPFNSSYLDPGTTKFLCLLSIGGTNYTDSKTVEYYVDNGISRLLGSSVLPSLLVVVSLVLVP